MRKIALVISLLLSIFLMVACGDYADVMDAKDCNHINRSRDGNYWVDSNRSKYIRKGNELLGQRGSRYSCPNRFSGRGHSCDNWKYSDGIFW